MKERKKDKIKKKTGGDLGDEGVEWERDVAAQHLNHHPACMQGKANDDLAR